MVDYNNLPDDELNALIESAQAEKSRRAQKAALPAKMDELTRTYHAVEGTVEGAGWAPPSGALDAYPSSWKVKHNGKVWKSLTPGNVWEPGTSGWREVVPEGEAPASWIQPTGAHDAYMMWDRVEFNGSEWFSTLDANVWQPGVAGWQTEESPEPEIETPVEVPPVVAPPVIAVPVAPNWKQPAGGHDAYKAGDAVSYSGKTWVSTANANVWQPGVYGWTAT